MVPWQRIRRPSRTASPPLGLDVMRKQTRALADYEHIWFDPWKPWHMRYRPSLDFEVPESFGIFGIYLIAAFQSTPVKKEIEPTSLPKEVVYIGMSSHVDRRLEKSHSAVRKYRRETGDERCENLWYGRAYSSWSNGVSGNIEMARAYIVYYERALILEYTRANEALPKYNRI